MHKINLGRESWTFPCSNRSKCSRIADGVVYPAPNLFYDGWVEVMQGDGKSNFAARYVLGSCAVSCKNVYSFFIHMIHILPCSQQVCQSVWKSLKKKPKIDHIWKSRSTKRRNIAVCVKVKMRHFWWFSNIVCPFSLSNASKVDNLLLSAVPSLNYASTSLKKKFLFVSKRVFDVYGHFTQKWGWIPQSFFKILINECEFFASWIILYVFAAFSGMS